MNRPSSPEPAGVPESSPLDAEVRSRSRPHPVSPARWPVLVGALFCWLAVEDLIRKVLDNPIGVYFVKDVIVLVLLIAALRPGVGLVARFGSHETGSTGE